MWNTLFIYRANGALMAAFGYLHVSHSLPFGSVCAFSVQGRALLGRGGRGRAELPFRLLQMPFIRVLVVD